MTTKLYKNIKMLLCKEWGISPFEFDQKQEKGEILLFEVFEYISMLMQTEPFKAQAIANALFGDKIKKEEEAKQKLLDEINQNKNYYKMLAMAKGKTDKDEEIKKLRMEKVLEEIKRLEGLLYGK